MRRMNMLFYGQEKVGRWIGLLVFVAFTVRQVLPMSLGGMYPGLENGLVFIRWCLVTLLFLLFLHAYIVRTPAKELANRPVEVLLPLVCAPLPILVIVITQLSFQQQNWEWIHENGVAYPFTPLMQGENSVVTLGLLIMGAGEVVTIAGMLWLRSSFSIFTEARGFVQQGLYRFVRHPLYTGEIISSWGYCVVIPTPLTIGGAALFSLLQMLRSKVEEKKLMKFYPEYEEYQRNVGFLLPKFKRK